MNNAGRIAFIIKGNYDDTATYNFLDIVYFGNSSYVAKKTTKGNEPPEKEDEFWQILISTPDTSVTGIKGAAETEFRSGNVTLTPSDIGVELPENIENNGTGGISAGTGLLTSSEKMYNYIFPSSSFTKSGSYYTDMIDGDEYYVVDYSGSYAQNTPQFSFMLEHMGEDLFEIYHSVEPGILYLPDFITSFADYIIVHDPLTISVYFYSEGHADNAAINFSLEIRESAGIKQPYQILLGAYNRNNTQYEPGAASLLEIGNGTASSRTNAMRLNYRNQMYLGSGGAYNASGADHAEFIKPWGDGNPDNEDRVGYLVTIKEGLLYKAEAGDFIVGITSGNPCLIGNADEDYYWKYERDEFNRIVTEYIPEKVQETDDEGRPVFDNKGKPVMKETGRMVKEPKIAEKYNPDMQESYVERKDRREWDYVGILGVLPVRDDGTCLPGQFCRCGQNGIATLSADKEFNSYFVIERISENVVSVLLK